MTPVEIKNACEGLEATITAKGYYMPTVTVYLNWIGYEITINIESRVDAYSGVKNEFINASYQEGFDVIFDRAKRLVSAMQPIQDAKRDAFIAAVGKLIEQGRDIGMEVEFLNPLTAMMSKLSTNIITKEPF